MTAADGSFLISGVPPGKNYTLVASRVGYDSCITTASVAVLQTTTVATLSLAKTSVPTTTGSLSGTALLSDGPPHAGIFVYLPQSPFITVTGASGAFSLAGVPPGSYSIAASKEGYSAAAGTVTVAAGSNADAGILSLAAIAKEVAPPLFSPSTGTFATDQQITLSNITPGASIYYTIATAGGTPPDPTVSSSVYSSPIPVAGSGTVATIKAIAAKAGMTTSAVAQCTISIVYAGSPTYSLGYDANGATSGSAPVDASTYLQGQSATVLGNSGGLARTGYSFAG